MRYSLGSHTLGAMGATVGLGMVFPTPRLILRILGGIALALAAMSYYWLLQDQRAAGGLEDWRRSHQIDPGFSDWLRDHHVMRVRWWYALVAGALAACLVLGVLLGRGEGKAALAAFGGVLVAITFATDKALNYFIFHPFGNTG